MAEPTPTAPQIPASYGVPTDGSGGDLLPWSWADERLLTARNYWVCTTRGDGRPHAVPVWGLWLDGAVWFSSGRTSQKARNLASNREAIVHLESGDETVILEGEVTDVVDRAARVRFAEAYEPKYGFRPDPADEGSAVFALQPRIAHTWLERDYPRTATRWVFGEASTAAPRL